MAIEKRKIKEDFFNQINLIVDWRPIDRLIRKYYQKGESVTGRPSYEGLVLFKICLLQTWYGLSDYEVEDQVNDRISFSRFTGISLDEKAPDHSVISRFRTALTQKNAYDKLLQIINQQLESKQIIVKQGTIVDASVTDTPRKPKGKKEYEVVEDRNEDEQKKPADKVSLEVKTKPGVDTQAKWIKKAGKLRYGYKQHTATDEQGLVLGIVTTSANESDTKHFEDVLIVAKPKRGTWVKADKGYKSANNDEVIRKMKLKNHIMRKAPKKGTLPLREAQCNKLISKIRYKVERTFGSIKRWFGGGTARYIGLEKMHTQHLMEAMAYNLYRSPGIIMSNCES
ncbi:MAG: IS5 family transposase [Bacteroidales bacterium]|nr:IS5 family transposase [Bacteroidales bacterium]